MTKWQKQGAQYPRSSARSELAIKDGVSDKYAISDGEFENVSDFDKNTQLKAKFCNYTAVYAYLLDLICGFVTDFRTVDNAILDEPTSHYYRIRLKRETVEKYAFGKYTKARAAFWKSLYKVLTTPKTLVMITPEGDYLGEPIRLLARLSDGRTLKENFENLKSAEKMIESLEIEFFKPMFRQLVENHENYLILPRHLQAVIDTALIEYPEIAEWQAYSQFRDYEPEKLTAQEIRLYFMFLADRDNGAGTNLYLPDIEFWQSVRPNNVRCNKRKIEPDESFETPKNAIMKGSTLYQYYLCDWYKSKYEIDALARVHSFLLRKGELDGFGFTTCKSFYEKDEQRYRLTVYRENPLTAAPVYQCLEQPFDNGDDDDNWLCPF